jgi:hypothetical protein
VRRTENRDDRENRHRSQHSSAYVSIRQHTDVC